MRFTKLLLSNDKATTRHKFKRSRVSTAISSSTKSFKSEAGEVLIHKKVHFPSENRDFRIIYNNCKQFANFRLKQHEIAFIFGSPPFTKRMRKLLTLCQKSYLLKEFVD